MIELVDTLVSHAHLFTMQGDGVGYVADGAVTIKADKIAAVGPSAELITRFRARETLDAGNCAVLPGLIVLQDYQVLTVDEAAVRVEAQSQAEAVARQVDLDPAHKNMALLTAMAAHQL